MASGGMRGGMLLQSGMATQFHRANMRGKFRGRAAHLSFARSPLGLDQVWLKLKHKGVKSTWPRSGQPLKSRAQLLWLWPGGSFKFLKFEDASEP